MEKATSQRALLNSSIRSKYGFVPDTSVSPFRNAVRLRASKENVLCTPFIENMAFHDLTPGKIARRAAKSLLGLGSKFIVTPATTTGDISSTIERLDRDMRLKVFFADGMDDDVTFAAVDLNSNSHSRSKLYVKSDWTPSVTDVPYWVCQRMSRFFARCKELYSRRRASSNLLPFQERLLESLSTDENLLFPETDKGLGPCAVTYNQYITDCLVHLTNAECYQRLSEDEAMASIKQLDSEIDAWLDKYEKVIGKMKYKFIRKNMSKAGPAPFGQFYVLYKIHKPMKDDRWTTRPVCSDVSSLPHALGKWVTEELVPVQQRQDSYFKDSFALKLLLDSLRLPPNARFFTSDAQSMYTNIRTEPALEAISAYLFENRSKYSYCAQALVDALHIVFRNNYFKFGDTFWKQISGTAMGTPPAPPWATIFYALYENELVPRWQSRIPFYKRFIDDVIGIWLSHPDPDEDRRLWNAFELDMNQWHGLKWDCETPSLSVNFMDLTISIEDGRAITTLYEKKRNLYLYIPPHSSHPKGVLTGLVFGQILRVRRLCSNKADADAKIQQFFSRLLARGHSRETLIPLFIKAEDNAKCYLNRTSSDHEARYKQKVVDSQRQIYFHIQYHPEDPPTSEIQKLWRDNVPDPPNDTPLRLCTNCEGYEVGINKLVVAYSRPLNLRNRFSVRTFTAGEEMSHHTWPSKGTSSPFFRLWDWRASPHNPKKFIFIYFFETEVVSIYVVLVSWLAVQPSLPHTIVLLAPSGLHLILS